MLESLSAKKQVRICSFSIEHDGTTDYKSCAILLSTEFRSTDSYRAV